MEIRALRFHGPGDVRLEHLDLPAPGPGEVLVGVEASGVCGSDVHFVDGSARTGAVPVTLGHEIAGRVVESSHPQWAPGDPVVVGPAQPCRRCAMCGQGRSNLCERRRLIGVDFDGGWADAVVVGGDALIRPPNGVSPVAAATAVDAGATAYHAVARRGSVSPGHAVAVIGAGGLGSYAIQIAKLLGAAPIIVADTSQEALNRAGSLGADELIHVTDGVSIGREIRMLADGGADVALEFVGAAATVDAAVKSLRPGGRAVAAGVGVDPLTTLAPVIWSANEYELHGAFGSLPGDIERVLAWLADGTVTPPHTADVALAEAAGAVLAAAAGETPPGRLMVRP